MVLKNILLPLIILKDFIRGYAGVYFNYLKNNKSNFKYNLAVVAIIRNEAVYLKEWIEYHKIVGVQVFYIYDNYSTDNVQEVLNPYIDKGEVIYKLFPETEVHSNTVQRNAYNDCIKNYKNETKWLAVIDADEFLVPVEKFSLLELLEEKQYKSVRAFDINWILYGYGGNLNRPSGLITENYTRSYDKTKATTTPPEGWEWINKSNYKSIVNPRIVKKLGIHGGSYILGIQSLKMDMNVIRLNHYWTKSYEEMNEKITRNRNWKKNVNSIKYKIIPEYDPEFLSNTDDYIIKKYILLLKEKI